MHATSTAFLLLGIDQIAIEVEQPLDVLPLHAFARGMCSDVLAVLESWAAMPPLQGSDVELAPAAEAVAGLLAEPQKGRLKEA